MPSGVADSDTIADISGKWMRVIASICYMLSEKGAGSFKIVVIFLAIIRFCAIIFLMRL